MRSSAKSDRGNILATAGSLSGPGLTARPSSVRKTPLYISRDVDYDWLIALEFGRVLDSQPRDHFVAIDDDCAYVLDESEGDIIGFSVGNLTEFDPEEHSRLWCGPVFDAPVFGLREVYAGAIILATKAHLLNESTTNRAIFDTATSAKDEEAVALWRQCLECGDSMAHYALGYTLLKMGRHREAYGHLREYTDLCPWNGWAWCWFGKACEALGERTAARDAYRQAVEIDDDETDAPELLNALGEDA